MTPSTITTLNQDILPPPEPWPLFQDWYELAEKCEPNDPNAMALATAAADGMPSTRMVLMKSYEAAGITFFTNDESQKGRELKVNPQAALCFHWKSLRRQIRLQGTVCRISDEASDAYFASRARGSQVGAWASQQSRFLANRDALKQRVSEVEKKFDGQAIPRPAYWGGYLLTPLRIEFWQDREFRLHERVVYIRGSAAGAWLIERLYP